MRTHWATWLAALAVAMTLTGCDKLGSGTPKPTTNSSPAASAPP